MPEAGGNGSAPDVAAWRIAVVGAGPAGLALALQAARKLPQARIALFDARPLDRDVRGDARTLALSLGSVQDLRRLGAWDDAQAQPILEVHVSQDGALPPRLALDAAVTIDAASLGVPMLGAVQPYGTLVATLQARWLEAARHDDRLATHFGQAVRTIEPAHAEGADAGHVTIERADGTRSRHDLAVIAEGGVFAEQSRRAIGRDYGQTAWVGRVAVEGGVPGRAIERFTRDGPLALLPLPPSASPLVPGLPEAALVWCRPPDEALGADAVGTMQDAARIAAINARLPAAAGRVAALSPLKSFALGLNAERRLVEGRIARIGNAAQTLHPVAGQGLNLGLRDAAVLVHELADALDASTQPGGRPAWSGDPQGQPIGRALARWQRARQVDRYAMIGATDFLARSFTWPLPGLATLRGTALALLQQAGPLKAMLARQMMFGSR